MRGKPAIGSLILFCVDLQQCSFSGWLPVEEPAWALLPLREELLMQARRVEKSSVSGRSVDHGEWMLWRNQFECRRHNVGVRAVTTETRG